ncbi:MAG: autotransporter outer membrane beta-barrel domain-containing protein [Pyramidobacter sp.]|nr:autotransporter outer membrane beta-barrel domain-containing protein [Pyramidobacter sp.]
MPGLPDVTLRGVGVVAGFDRRLSSSLTAGVSLTAVKMKMRGRGSENGTDSDSTGAGASLYAIWRARRMTIVTDAGYAWQRADITAAAEGRVFAVEDTKSRMLRAGLAVFWNLRSRGTLSVAPFAGVRLRRLTQKEFSSGPMTFDLDDAAQWTFPVGIRLRWSALSLGGWRVIPTLTAAYERVSGDRSLVIRQFFRGGELARYSTAALDRDLLRLSASIEARRQNAALSLNATGRLGRHQRSFTGSLALRFDL